MKIIQKVSLVSFFGNSPSTNCAKLTEGLKAAYNNDENNYTNSFQPGHKNKRSTLIRMNVIFLKICMFETVGGLITYFSVVGLFCIINCYVDCFV